jgi:hypothetical protein
LSRFYRLPLLIPHRSLVHLIGFKKLGLDSWIGAICG